MVTYTHQCMREGDFSDASGSAIVVWTNKPDNRLSCSLEDFRHDNKCIKERAECDVNTISTDVPPVCVHVGFLSLSLRANAAAAKLLSRFIVLKISFNESSLKSTYEYPSESSAWDSGEEDEEESRDEKVADEQPSMVGRIPHPSTQFHHLAHAHDQQQCSITMSGLDNSTATGHIAMTFPSDIHAPQRLIPNDFGGPLKQLLDLSSYVPKHSVDFSAWQEHKHDDSVYQEDTTSQNTQMTEEVMLTPADSSSLSDYSSEPALYF
ncbi:Taperin [Collichthys lucidus]|uniref:Taperin n=1 Tax=Collichthys lucidus TaxID=240159 RepID=A0A4V6ARF1_COLLU|nr:Taperin [Collichthys lucidus]